MDAETASFLDPRAEYQVTLQDGLLETQANHLTRERLTDLGGPADLNGGPEELAGLEANTNVIITMLAITIIMLLASISNRKESDDCRFLKVHRPTLPRQPPRQDLPPDLHIEPWSLLSSITNSQSPLYPSPPDPSPPYPPPHSGAGPPWQPWPHKCPCQTWSHSQVGSKNLRPEKISKRFFRDALSKAMKLRKLTPETCAVYRLKNTLSG